jgi:hypothetical protein
MRTGVDTLVAAWIPPSHRRFHDVLDEAGSERIGVPVDEANDFSLIGSMCGADHEVNRFAWSHAEPIAVPDQSHRVVLLLH